ncbi:MAG: alkaline phosphatase family protein [Myxococcales bacterium]|nr:alkaline phosphatase family protein [Myxococcales bacterium]
MNIASAPDALPVEHELCRPQYEDACVTNVVPALLRRRARAWLPEEVARAPVRVLLVIDGLGWEQLAPRRERLPTLAAMRGRDITTVAPSTTAAALSSIATGRAPAEHGILGYHMRVEGEVMNALRWTIDGRDVRERLDPAVIQPIPPFLGEAPPVVSKLELAGSGFSRASLRGARYHGYKVVSSLAVDVGALARARHEFIYAYYDGVDRVAHQHGLFAHYDAELRFVDGLVRDVLTALPTGAALVVTADHGHVQVGDDVVTLHEDVTRRADGLSGEARFLWLHARPGRAPELLEAARARHGQQAWCWSREQVLDEGLLGPTTRDGVARRCGDVALLSRGRCTLVPDALDIKQGRHGALTPAEMRVPLLYAIA